MSRLVGKRVLLVVSCCAAVVALAWYFSGRPRSGQGLQPAGILIPTGTWWSFTTDYPTGYDSKGYDFFSRFEYMRALDGPKKGHSHDYQGRLYEVLWEASANTLVVKDTRGELARFSMEPWLNHLIGSRKAQLGPQTLPQSELTLESPDHRVRLYMEDVSGVFGERWTLYHLRLVALVRAR